METLPLLPRSSHLNSLLMRVTKTLKFIRETRSALRSRTEFYGVHPFSRPADTTQVMSRITYNTRYFSSNYILIILVLAVYAVITGPAPLLFIATASLLSGGLALLINKSGPIIRKLLYTILFVIGLPFYSTIFWIAGASSCFILGHAALTEPGVESKHATVQDSV
ncbi:PRA1 family protein-domain-containing protein [Boletus edulis]|nr:PRA1 family protein-domain-containing protein [Boletus edulis]